MPVAAFVVARAASQHCDGYQPSLQTSPHCHAGSIVKGQSSGAFAPHIAEAFRHHFYLRHTPTLANFKHLDDFCKRADNARFATPGTGNLSPDSRELPSLVADIEFQVTSVRGRRPRLVMSTNSPPGEPQFPVARVSN
jgi:hypothetical protein